MLDRLYAGSAEERREMVNSFYAEDAEYQHVLYSVKGRDNIFGIIHAWAIANRYVKYNIKRIGAPGQHRTRMADLQLHALCCKCAGAARMS